MIVVLKYYVRKWAMILKERVISDELRLLRSLDPRMGLSEEVRNHYVSLEKGFLGELMFDQLTEKLTGDKIIINDLCLQYNKTFQIDTLIILQDALYIFEVKSFEGDYIYENENFSTLSRYTIQNPLDQLKRSRIALNQLMKSLGVQLPIEGYVVFINPEFTLYQAPIKAPIIYPTQLTRFLKKFDEKTSKLNNGHIKIAEQLISLHQTKLPFTNVPEYEYDRLTKGILCSNCNAFVFTKGINKVICGVCGKEEKVESALLRAVEEIRLLYPEKKITTNSVHEWCSIIPSKKMISRILKENFKLTGFGQWTYYE